MSHNFARILRLIYYIIYIDILYFTILLYFTTADRAKIIGHPAYIYIAFCKGFSEEMYLFTKPGRLGRRAAARWIGLVDLGVWRRA